MTIETVYDGKFLRILKNGNWEYASRTNAADAVIIVPVDGKDLIMISEYRVPLQARVLGFPAGLVGDKDKNEDLFAAARREMVEEVGMLPNSVKLLAENLPSSSGLTDEKFSMVLATDLVQVGSGGGDSTEDIQIVRVPLVNAAKEIASRSRLQLISPKIYIGLYFLRELNI